MRPKCASFGSRVSCWSRVILFYQVWEMIDQISLAISTINSASYEAMDGLGARQKLRLGFIECSDCGWIFRRKKTLPSCLSDDDQAPPDHLFFPKYIP
jgi:hypothetical protein